MHHALLEFDDLGVLRATQIPTQFAWMTNGHIDLLLAVLSCGAEGLARRRTRKYPEARADALRQLELRDYVQWERDRRGRLSFLCLTWRGEEAVRFILKVAHHGQKVASIGGKEESSCCN